MLCQALPRVVKGPSCAVVGSADYATNRGPLIDAHDLVWRMNDAPTIGFERLVGSKTTNRILNRVSVSIWAKRQHVEYRELHKAYSIHAFDPSVCFNLTCVLVDADARTLSDLAEARRLHPRLRVKVDLLARNDARICKANGAKPRSRSAGFVAVVRALRTCRVPIDLFGFDQACCTNASRAYKYYHNARSKWVCCSSGREDMALEATVLDGLATEGKVVFADNVSSSTAPASMRRSLDVPTFRRTNRHVPLPKGALFRSCTNASQTLCAVRRNSMDRQILIVANRIVVATIDDADDPRMFTHRGVHWILNNNYYRMTLVELFQNATLGRAIRIPIVRAKNLVPLSWSDKRFYLLDLQEKILWPAQLQDATTVLLERPVQLSARRTYDNEGVYGCYMPQECNARGGTQGVHLSPTDDLAYGVGHCTGRVRIGAQMKVQHTAYWWVLDFPKREITLSGLCFSERRLVDPTALYPVVQGEARRAWLVGTAEADQEWNRERGQPYYNELYRAVMRTQSPHMRAHAALPSRAPSRPEVTRTPSPLARFVGWCAHVFRKRL